MSEISIDQAVKAAMGHQQAGRLADAESIYRQILAVDPRHADTLHLLGILAQQCGRHDVAADYFSRALAVQPDNPTALYNLGRTRQARGEWESALACHERAVALLPSFAEAHTNRGMILHRLRRLDEAQRAYEQALAARPQSPEAHNNLGTFFLDCGRLDQARRCFERALVLRADFPEALNNLGNVLLCSYELDEARRCYERAVALRDLAEAHNHLGNVFRDTGQHDRALSSYRRSITLKPEAAWLHSNLILALHFHPETTAATFRAELGRWSQRHARPLRAARLPHANTPDPRRRLKVGYVSSDFREHAIRFFITPLLAAHDHERFEVHCYASVIQPDAVTGRQRALADVWHDVMGMSDEAVAAQVRADGIDILVDLGQHTGGNRLLVFARQPAPVQVSWLGSQGGAGLETIGYRLSDARIEPPDADKDSAAEQIVRLPDGWCCFDPLEETPPVNGLPALRQDGGVTFGSLNNFAKVNAPTLRLWARVLTAVPGSRLLLRCPPDTARAWAGGLLQDGGIGPERVEWVWREPAHDDYLRLYQRIDVALDPAPYNGMTTSCEALWMGVPMLTLPGTLPASRAGLSLLGVLGLEELAAQDEEDFVRIAVGLAGDLTRLADWRAGLRERMRGSALMDAPRFARHMEAAYTMMWQRWCESENPG